MRDRTGPSSAGDAQGTGGSGGFVVDCQVSQGSIRAEKRSYLLCTRVMLGAQGEL